MNSPNCDTKVDGRGQLERWLLSLRKHGFWVLYLGFYTLVANVPFWIVSKALGFDHRIGLFCIEYAFIGLVGLLAPRLLTAALLLAMMLTDTLAGLLYSYNLSVKQCFFVPGVVRGLPYSRLAEGASFLLLVLVVSSVPLVLPRTRLARKQRWYMAASLVIFAAAASGTTLTAIALRGGALRMKLIPQYAHDSINVKALRIPRLGRTPIALLTRIAITGDDSSDFAEANTPASVTVPSATAIAIRDAGIYSIRDPKNLPNVVLVLVESWGLAKDPSLQNALTAAYFEPQVSARYKVLQGMVPFYNGTTIAGEARELCGKGFGPEILDPTPEDIRSCLPVQLAAIGYEAIGLHGGNGSFFGRKNWYPAIGFREGWFNEQFRKQGLHDCDDAFVGTCDAEIATWIGRRLEGDNNPPEFIHWVTLNSHLPVPVPSPLPHPVPCVTVPFLFQDAPLCSWYQLVANVHQSVVRMATGKLARPTIFVVVGDHTPPFSDPEKIGRFVKRRVPYLILLPRSLAEPVGPDVSARVTDGLHP